MATKKIIYGEYYDLLGIITREELRIYAKKLNVERGQNKKDTIRNLLKSHKVELFISLNI